MSRAPADFLWDTPPNCPGPGCYVHGVPELEHHVEGCPMFDTIAAQMHRLDHAIEDAKAAIMPELEAFVASLSRLGRIRFRWSSRRWR